MTSNGAAREQAHHGHVYHSYAAPQWPDAHCSSKEQYDAMYKESLEAPEQFWGRIASEFHWQKKWEAPFHRCPSSAMLASRKLTRPLGGSPGTQPADRSVFRLVPLHLASREPGVAVSELWCRRAREWQKQ